MKKQALMVMAAVVSLGLMAGSPAQAFGGGHGGGGHGGGFHGGGFHGGGFHGGGGFAGRGYGGGSYWPGLAGAGLGLGLLGAGLYSYPYGYGYDDYAYSGAPYPYGPSPAVQYETAPGLVMGRSVAAGQSGDYCTTPVKTCKLYHTSIAGGGCSCKVSGGRARGTVSP